MSVHYMNIVVRVALRDEGTTADEVISAMRDDLAEAEYSLAPYRVVDIHVGAE